MIQMYSKTPPKRHSSGSDTPLEETPFESSDLDCIVNASSGSDTPLEETVCVCLQDVASRGVLLYIDIDGSFTLHSLSVYCYTDSMFISDISFQRRKAVLAQTLICLHLLIYLRIYLTVIVKFLPCNPSLFNVW
eukprot:GHVO01054236.1.p1 GENE.GHVO01054236.1~~GHVO01054236.1.p1  ORF type:complete len:134 (-),score=2.11 GHVO01054236.1:144-545(-)